MSRDDRCQSPLCGCMDGCAVEEAVKEERMRCAHIVATKFEEARDTEFDLGFETARRVFAAAILNPNN